MILYSQYHKLFLKIEQTPPNVDSKYWKEVYLFISAYLGIKCNAKASAPIDHVVGDSSQAQNSITLP